MVSYVERKVVEGDLKAWKFFLFLKIRVRYWCIYLDPFLVKVLKMLRLGWVIYTVLFLNYLNYYYYISSSHLQRPMYNEHFCRHLPNTIIQHCQKESDDIWNFCFIYVLVFNKVIHIYPQNFKPKRYIQVLLLNNIADKSVLKSAHKKIHQSFPYSLLQMFQRNKATITET